jgi:chromosome segregation ATPase
MKRLLWLASVLLLSGCNDADRDEVQRESSVAAEHAGKAVSLAFSSLGRKLSAMNLGNSRQALADAQKRGEDAMADLQNQGDQASKQFKDLEVQVDRMRAAINVKDLQAKIDDLTNKAKEADENLEKTKQRLDESNKAFKSVEDQLGQAKSQYDKLTNDGDNSN